ncbi:hypothetical protein K4F52_010316 [Lecanicillium sp. MT-2017a]|nr:hypothetical protein K4F52_010316 [Lecanicillium sp. MT-2017a]
MKPFRRQAYDRLRRGRRLARHFRLSIKYLLYVFVSIFIFCPIYSPSYTNPAARYTKLVTACTGPQPKSGCANPRQAQIFINAVLDDKYGQLLGGLYGENLLKLIHILGEQNVFLSIYEHGNEADGIVALNDFRKRLACRHELVHEDHVSLDNLPTVTMPDGSQRVKRLTYLAKLRNRVMWPLDQFNETVGTFDKVLFLSEVYYNPIDAAQLLFSTNALPHDQDQYLAACAVGYCQPAKFCDSYATRDADGFPPGSEYFPIFAEAGRALSRQDMFHQADAVRVSSCWSGMVAMQAKWLQNLDTALPRPDFHDVATHAIDPDRPTSVVPPIRFRYEPEVFVDACEWCLFLADVYTVARNAAAPQLGIYMNPYVRITYKPGLLPWVQLMKYWERALALPQTIVSWLKRPPASSHHRTVQEGDEFREEIWVPDHTTGKGSWVLKERTGRNGLFCWVRMMHLIRRESWEEGARWGKASIPPGNRQ